VQHYIHEAKEQYYKTAILKPEKGGTWYAKWCKNRV